MTEPNFLKSGRSFTKKSYLFRPSETRGFVGPVGDGEEAASCTGLFDGDWQVDNQDTIFAGQSACDGALGVGGGGIPWLGTFNTKTVNPGCQWDIDDVTDQIFHSGSDIAVYNESRIFFNNSQGYWQLDIRGFDVNPNAVDLWTGKKETGSNPVGVYTKISGCFSGPATISVSEV